MGVEVGVTNWQAVRSLPALGMIFLFFPQEHAITSDDALVLDEIPTSGPIVILGAGYIAGV